MTTPQTAEDHRRQKRTLLRRTSSTGSLNLNMLQDDEDGNSSSSGSGSNSTNNSNRQSLSQQRPQQQQQQRDHVHYLSTLFAGVGSGALSSFICAPLDLIRTRMQVWGDIQQRQTSQAQTQTQTQSKTQPQNASAKQTKFGGRPNRRIPSIGGPAEAFRAILKKEGPRGMFRGLGATLVTVPLFWGVYFPLYDETKDFLTHRQDVFDVGAYHPGVVHCLSAIMTGAVADVICNPFFVVRTRLQTQALHELAGSSTSNSNNKNNNNKRLSMLQMARLLKEQHGVPVFWRGMTANLIGLSHCAVQFPAYEFLKGYLRERRHLQNAENTTINSHNSNTATSNTTKGTDNTVVELLIASGLAKMTASLLSYPHEVLRSRMVDSRSSVSPTLIGTTQNILRKEGILGFYNGLGVTLIRVIPNCCVTFLSYELILKNSKEYFGN